MKKTQERREYLKNLVNIEYSVLNKILVGDAKLKNHQFIYFVDLEKSKGKIEEFKTINYLAKFLDSRLNKKSFLLGLYDVSSERDWEGFKKFRGVAYIKISQEIDKMNSLIKSDVDIIGDQFIPKLLKYMVEISGEKLTIDKSFEITEEDKKYGIDQSLIDEIAEVVESNESSTTENNQKESKDDDNNKEESINGNEEDL